MSRDNLLVARPWSQGVMPNTGEAVADALNSVSVPPGLYDVEVQYGVPTGAATSITATILEQGVLLGTALTNPIVNTYTPLVDARARTILGPGGAGAIVSTGRVFLRGVRITKWNNGAKNAGVTLAVAGGTTPTIPQIQVTFHPMSRSAQFNGLP
jgi:hypothetical protein